MRERASERAKERERESQGQRERERKGRREGGREREGGKGMAANESELTHPNLMRFAWF